MTLDNAYINKLKEKVTKYNDVELYYLVNKLLEEREELIRNSSMDGLTGVYNRRILDKIENYKVLVMLDIDDFKTINDSYGHDAGDYALKIVAKELLSNTRINDYVCRYGGDEFLIIFDECDSRIIEERMHKIQEDLNHPFRNMPYNIKLSIGIAEKKEKETLGETITNADIALYQSKNSGKNRITVYNDNMLTLNK